MILLHGMQFQVMATVRSSQIENRLSTCFCERLLSGHSG